MQLDTRIWAELLKAVLNLEFLKGYRTTLSIIGFVGLILYSCFGAAPNYEQAVTAFLALLAILGLRNPDASITITKAPDSSPPGTPE